MIAELSAAPPPPRTAAQWLSASMTAGRGRNVVYEALQRDTYGDGTHRRVRVSRDKQGRVKSEILAPSSLAGSVTLDDGRTVSIYLPAQRRATSQPRIVIPEDVAKKMRLANVNYKFRFGPKEKVAGRWTRVVIATPRRSGLLERWFWVDTQSYLPLRMDLRQGVRAITTLRVLKVGFPTAFPRQTFKFFPPRGVRTESVAPPTPATYAIAARRCGFAPIVPAKLPFGYRVEGLHVAPMDDWTLLAVNLTDGLSRTTVYQLPAKASLGAWERDAVTVGSLRLYVSTDLLPAQRRRLLAAFGRSE